MDARFELQKPPAAGGERETLVGFLDYHRAVLARKADGLTRDQLGHRIEPSPLTLAGLLKHMAIVEDGWFAEGMAGEQGAEKWRSVPWDDDPDWEFTTAPDDDPEQLFAWFGEAVERSREITERFALDDMMLRHEPPRPAHNLRWILVHLIEEYARHCGHADLLREAVDGATGD